MEIIGGTEDYEQYYTILETGDHDILCAGGFYAIENDLLFTRFDENIVTAEHQPADLPATLTLSPNPAGVLLTVHHDGLEQVKIFTAEGQLVRKLAVDTSQCR